jgi:hypothetical protein
MLRPLTAIVTFCLWMMGLSIRVLSRIRKQSAFFFILIVVLSSVAIPASTQEIWMFAAPHRSSSAPGWEEVRNDTGDMWKPNAPWKTVARSVKNVTIQGKYFYLDGKAWLPKGGNIVAFVRPRFIPSAPKWMNDSNGEGRQWWGDAEFRAVKEVLGGNVLRFQISQAALDPSSPIYDKSYLAELSGAIRQARAADFVVICSMNWGDNSGLQHMVGIARRWDRARLASVGSRIHP